MSTEILSLNEPKNLVDLDSALPRSRGPALDILGLFANNVVSFALWTALGRWFKAVDLNEIFA
jgi:hypothetical protein